MRSIAALAAVMIALLASGCASVRYSDESNRGVSFASYQTYDWMTLQNEAVPNLVDRRIRRIITAEMAGMGVRQVNRKPAVLVTYHTGDGRRIDVSTLGYSYGTWGRVDDDDYRDGTIIVDIVDTTTKELVWRGWVTGILDSRRTTEELNAAIDEAVVKLMSRYPSK